MALLPYVDPARAQPQVREVLSTLPDLNLFRMIAHAPTVLRPWVDLGGALLTRLEVDPVLRELVILQVAQSTGSEYERTHHEGVAEGVGAGSDQIELLARTPAERSASAMEDAFTPVQRAAVDLAEEVVRTGRAGQARVSDLRRHLSDRAIIELLLVIGYYTSVAMLTETVRLDLDRPVGMSVVDAVRRESESRE
jgi:alkylhydroperoxidase family enzyme